MPKKKEGGKNGVRRLGQKPRLENCPNKVEKISFSGEAEVVFGP
jgi:hypothetical protein